MTGSAKLLEDKLGRPLLWLPCRKHISELFLGTTWVVLFGVDQSPFIIRFKDFQNKWSDIDQTKAEPLKLKKPWLIERAQEIIKFCQKKIWFFLIKLHQKTFFQNLAFKT